MNNKVIKDLVHGDIEVTQVDRKIIDSPYLQRLHYIKQNSLAFLVYPSLVSSRFEHSLGVMQLGSRIFSSALYNSDKKNPFIEKATNDLKKFKFNFKNPEKVKNFLRQVIRVAALIHDTGHFPFSHATEKAFSTKLKLSEYYLSWICSYFREKSHEFLTIGITNDSTMIEDPKIRRACVLTLLSDIFEKNPEDIKPFPLLSKFLESLRNSCFYFLKKIISSAVDADRGDYLLRDGKISGSGFGNYDLDRLLFSLRIAHRNNKFFVGISEKGLSTIESFLIGRYQLFKNIYLHKKIIIFNKILQLLLHDLQLHLEHFIDTCKKEDIEHYLGNLIDYLSGKGKIIKILRGKNFILKPEFLIQIEKNVFLDDYWLLSKIRAINKKSLYPFLDCITRRKRITFVWKTLGDMKKAMYSICVFVKKRSSKNGFSFEDVNKEEVSLLMNTLALDNKELLDLWFKRTAISVSKKYKLVWDIISPSSFLVKMDDVSFVNVKENWIPLQSSLLNGIDNSLDNIEISRKKEVLVWLGFIVIKNNNAKDRIEKQKKEIINKLIENFKYLYLHNTGKFKDQILKSLEAKSKK